MTAHACLRGSVACFAVGFLLVGCNQGAQVPPERDAATAGSDARPPSTLDAATPDQPSEDGAVRVDLADSAGTDVAAADTASTDGSRGDRVDGAPPDTVLPADAAGSTDLGALPADARDGATDVGTRLCRGTTPSTGRICRSVDDCRDLVSPVVCSVGPYNWGSAACPLAPNPSSCPQACTGDKDCVAQAGGTCIPVTFTCPRCQGHSCQYPPPPCTQTPNSCGDGSRCRSDGACEVIPCNEGSACVVGSRCNATSPKADLQGCEPITCDQGFTCGADTRCNLTSTRADAHGCELTPCSAGYACAENTRCLDTAPTPSSHGCQIMICKADGDCDCGYCVNGTCSAAPGTCQQAPQ